MLCVLKHAKRGLAISTQNKQIRKSPLKTEPRDKALVLEQQELQQDNK